MDIQNLFNKGFRNIFLTRHLSGCPGTNIQFLLIILEKLMSFTFDIFKLLTYSLKIPQVFFHPILTLIMIFVLFIKALFESLDLLTHLMISIDEIVNFFIDQLVGWIIVVSRIRTWFGNFVGDY